MKNLPSSPSLPNHTSDPVDPSSPAGEPVALIRPSGPSLRNNSLARLVADLLGVGFALFAATISARLLGPAGKGYYSSLALMAGLFVQVFSAGLGEAAIVLAGRGRASLQDAASATMAAILPLSVLASGLFFVLAGVVFRTETDGGGHAVLIATAFVAISISYTTVVSFLVAKERVAAVAAVSVLANTTTTVALWSFLAWAKLGVVGALLASSAGAGIALATAIILLQRSGVSLWPRRVKGYLHGAVRFGAALQFSNLLVLMTARLDLILVYRLRSPSAAGSYSIALTIGALVGAAPIAISYASFPRLANLDEDQARMLTTQTFRIGMVAAVAGGGLLALGAPFGIPLVFGHAYVAALAATLLLIPSGIIWSAQWLLCRAAAARGAPASLLSSFAASVAVMLALDFVLIRPFAGAGAAFAALVGSSVGLLVALLFYRRGGWQWRNFLPRIRDVTSVAAMGRQMWTQARRG